MRSQLTHKTNIVLLTDCLADLAGGAEKQIVGLAKALDKDKYEVFVLSLDCQGRAPKGLIESTGSRLHIFRVIRIYGLSGMVQGLRFYQFLKRERINVLMTYHFSSDIWGTFWGHLAGVPTIISNRRDMGFWRNGWHVQAYKLINGWVKKIVVVSQSIKQMVMEQEGIGPGRIEVIYNGVQVPEQSNLHHQEARGQLGFKNDDIVIMHTANLKPVKGHRYLLQAFAAVSRQCPHAKLVLIGRDELAGQLQSMAKELGVSDKVLFLGKRDDVPSLLRAADICVLPSLSEGLSNAVLEYMAAAKPVVATNVGGNRELLQDGFNGLLVEKENTQQLKDALMVLLKDTQKRGDMGHNGHKRVEKEFSMATMVSRYERLFGQIRVLHLISSGGLFGAERVVLNLAAHNNGVQAIVGAINNKHNPHLEIIEEAKHLGLGTIVFDSGGRFDLKTIARVRQFMVDNRIDVLHTHNYKSDMIGFCAMQGTKIKWVTTIHGWIKTDQKLKFYENVDAFVLRFAKKIIGVSSEIVLDLKRKHFKENRLEVIDNGIPIGQFNNTRNEQLRLGLGLRPEDCAVVIVGRLAREKGHEIFLKAANLVIKRIQNVKFVIVGNGPLRKELEEQVANLGLSKYVIFTGVRQDMPAVYACCDIMVNASYKEGLPMTILEAMASRLPVIATRVGAVGDVIKDAENGALLKAGDVDGLALAIVGLVQDKEKRQALAEAAYRDVCSRFSDVRMAQKYKQVYVDILVL